MPEPGTDVPDRYPEHLERLAESLLNLVASDVSGRGVSQVCNTGDFLLAARILSRSRHVTIVTGFLVPEAGHAETDGPPGSCVLGRVLSRAGIKCRIVTDSACMRVVSACSEALGGPEVRAVDDPGFVLDEESDCLVFVERLGRAQNGGYYNMRKMDISHCTCPLDIAAVEARKRNIPVVAFGDGGNEAGMGAFGEELPRLLPDFSGCLCAVGSDACVAVDVSNWGCYAVGALVSAFGGKWHGHSPEEETAMLRAMESAGAVDGATRERGLSVDGFPEAVNLAVVEAVLEVFQAVVGEKNP